VWPRKEREREWERNIIIVMFITLWCVSFCHCSLTYSIFFIFYFFIWTRMATCERTELSVFWHTQKKIALLSLSLSLSFCSNNKSLRATDNVERIATLTFLLFTDNMPHHWALSIMLYLYTQIIVAVDKAFNIIQQWENWIKKEILSLSLSLSLSFFIHFWASELNKKKHFSSLFFNFFSFKNPWWWKMNGNIIRIYMLTKHTHTHICFMYTFARTSFSYVKLFFLSSSHGASASFDFYFALNSQLRLKRWKKPIHTLSFILLNKNLQNLLVLV
jgi:hypothetical protein